MRKREAKHESFRLFWVKLAQTDQMAARDYAFYAL